MPVAAPRSRGQVIEELRGLGLNLIPLLPKSKRPAIQWKPYQDRRYTGAIPGSQNFGVVCGSISGNLVVLDIDIEDPSLPDKVLESATKKTLVVRTGSGRYHVYVRCKELPKSGKMQGSRGRVEIKSSGAYIVGPTSVHPDTGREYEIISDGTGIAEVDYRRDVRKNLEDLGFCAAKGGARGRSTAGGSVKRGKRHDSALRYANSLLFKKRLDERTVRKEMERWNGALEEPLPSGEISRLVDDAVLYHHDTLTKEKPDEKEELLSFARGKILKTVTSLNDPSKVYCMVESGGSKPTIELGSPVAASWLAAVYYLEADKIVPDDMCRQALNLLKSIAKLGDTSAETVHRRIAVVDNVLYYDLCNKKWELIRVASDSIRTVRHGEDTPMFLRTSNQAEQVTPDLSPAPGAIESMCTLLRMKTLVFQAHLLSFFLESIPTPIMLITGQQGSIKSTQSGLIKRIVDPAGDALEDNLSTFPPKSDDLIIHLTNNLVAALDNLSKITPRHSDILCKAVTGARYTKRQLYTDAQEVTLRYKRKIVLNGITLDVERGDLAERTIFYRTSAIPKDQRRTAAYVEKRFREMLPGFLGAAFRVLQGAIRMKGEVEGTIPDPSRMADFEVWGECISRAMGNPLGAFLAEYRQSIQDANDLLNEGSPIVPFISELLGGRGEDVRSARNFFADLKFYAIENQYDVKAEDFPKAPNKLRGFLVRSRPLLEDAGYGIEVYKNTEANPFTKNSTLIKTTHLSSPSSPSSPPTAAGRGCGEDGEHGGDTLEASS